jgi:hypothetical protein
MGQLGSGLASQWTSPVTETTFGVVPSGLSSTTKFVACDSDTLELKKTAKTSTGLSAGKLFPRASRRVITRWDAGGGIVMDVPARGLQQWLYPMLGSYGQAPAALTEDMSTGAYKAIHAAGVLDGNSFAMQKGVPSVSGTVEPVTYVGCKISEWELSCAAGEIAKLNLTVAARNELAGTGNSDPLNGSVPGLVTYSAPPGGVFHWAQASLYTGGTVSTTGGVTSVSSPVLAGNIKSFSIKQTTPLDTDRLFSGNGGFVSEQLQNQLRSVTGQFVVEWLSSEARYDGFAADTATALELTFLGPSIGSGSDFSTLTILLAQIYLEGESPKIGGPQVVTQTVPFTAYDDDVDNVIQATYWTLDST